MNKLYRYENVDLEAALGAVLKSNTEAYQNDFDIDMPMFRESLDPEAESRFFLWASRRNGTICYPEEHVYLLDTSAYCAWTYYTSPYHNVKAYAVEVLDEKDGTIYGNVCELDYLDSVRKVQRAAVEPDKVLVFEKGRRICEEGNSFESYMANTRLGRLKFIEFLPPERDQANFRRILENERSARRKLPLGNIKAFLESMKAA